MVKGIAVGGLAMALLGAGAVGGYKTLSQAREAEVLSVKDVTEAVVTPQERCTDVQVSRTAPVQDDKRVAGTIVGGLAGGLLGNQIGGGNGKTLATIAGVAAGGYAGNQVQRNLQDRDTTTTTEHRCRTVNEKSQRVVGYDVTYRYNGKQSVARMTHKPGATVLVKDGKLVDVSANS